MKILVAEDEAALGRFIVKVLTNERHDVHLVADGNEAEALAVEREYDLLILDLNLPGKDGVQVLESIRSQSRDVPVLILTGRGGVSDRVLCLDNGADDYLVKPFSFHELLARVRALSRRNSPPIRASVSFADLELDRVARKATRAGKEIELTPKEFALLEYLLLNAGHLVSRDKIIEQVWNLSTETRTNVVDVYMNHLRKKVDGDHPVKLIQTVRGAGYELNLAKKD